jgi:hypothetical protein
MVVARGWPRTTLGSGESRVGLAAGGRAGIRVGQAAISHQLSAISYQLSAIRNRKGVQSDRKFPARLNPFSPFLPFSLSTFLPQFLFSFSPFLLFYRGHGAGTR